jgi:hypothetical protein
MGRRRKRILRSEEGQYTILFFFFAILGFELRAYTLSHSTNPFYDVFFWDRVSKTICPG